MKRISKAKGNISIRSIVYPDGVAFCAKKCYDFVCIESLVSEARLYGNKIETRLINRFSRVESIDNISKAVRIVNIILIILTVIAINYDSYLWKMAVIIGLFGVCAPKSITLFVWKITNKEYLKEAQFRAAMYQVVNAFYDLGRVPKVEDLERYSIFSRYDRYLEEEIKLLFAAISAVTLMNCTLVEIVIRMAIIIIVLIASFKLNIIYSIELLYLSKPNKMQQKTVITALENAVTVFSGINI